MKSLTGLPSTECVKLEATDPFYYVIVFWTSGQQWYGGRNMFDGASGGRLLNIGAIDTALDTHGALSISSCQVTLDDYDGQLKAKLQVQNFEGVKARVCMTYKSRDTGAVDYTNSIILLDGYVSGEITWYENQRELKFTIDSNTTAKKIARAEFELYPISGIQDKYRGDDYNLSIGNTPTKVLSMLTWGSNPVQIPPPAQRLSDVPTTKSNQVTFTQIGAAGQSYTGSIVVESTKDFPAGSASSPYWIAMKGNYRPKDDVSLRYQRGTLDSYTSFAVEVTWPSADWLQSNFYGRWSYIDIRFDRAWAASDGLTNNGASRQVWNVASIEEGTQNGTAMINLVASGAPPTSTAGVRAWIRISSSGGTLGDLAMNTDGIYTINTQSLKSGSTVINLNTNVVMPSGFNWVSNPGLTWHRNESEIYTITNINGKKITLNQGLLTPLSYGDEITLDPNIPAPNTNSDFLVYFLVYKTNDTTFTTVNRSHGGIVCPKGARITLCYPPDTVSGNTGQNWNYVNYWPLFFVDRHVLDYNAAQTGVCIGISGTGDQDSGILNENVFSGQQIRKQIYGPSTYPYFAMRLGADPEELALQVGYNSNGEIGFYDQSKTPKKFVELLKNLLLYVSDIDTSHSSWTSGAAFTNTDQGVSGNGENLGPFIMTKTNQRILDVARQACFEQRCQLVLSGNQAKIIYLPTTVGNDGNPAFVFTFTDDMIIAGSLEFTIPDTQDLNTVFEGKVGTWAMSGVKAKFDDTYIYQNTNSLNLYGYKKMPTIDFITTIDSASVMRCLKYWGYRLGSAWKTIQFSTSYAAIAVEVGDIVKVPLVDSAMLGTSVSSVIGRVMGITIDPVKHSIHFVVETPYKTGSGSIDPKYWTGDT